MEPQCAAIRNVKIFYHHTAAETIWPFLLAPPLPYNNAAAVTQMFFTLSLPFLWPGYNFICASAIDGIISVEEKLEMWLLNEQKT